MSLTSPLDDMSSRIDDLEKNIADLMTQAGVEELDAEQDPGHTEELKVSGGRGRTLAQVPVTLM